MIEVAVANVFAAATVVMCPVLAFFYSKRNGLLENETYFGVKENITKVNS